MVLNPRNIYDPTGHQQTGPIQTYVAHVVSISDPQNQGRLQIRPQGTTIGNVQDGKTGPTPSWLSHLGSTTNHKGSVGCRPGDKVVCADFGAHGHQVMFKFEEPENPRAGANKDKNLYPNRGSRIPMNDGKPTKKQPNLQDQDHTDAQTTPETYYQGCNSQSEKGHDKPAPMETMKECFCDKCVDPWDKPGPPLYA